VNGGPDPVRELCVFDLDHTLVRSSLDLRAMRADVRALAGARGLELPEAAGAWTVAQTIAAIARMAPQVEAEAWTIVLDHETRALEHVNEEPGAREALAALETAGFPLAVWTNNARPAAEVALTRSGLAPFFGTLVTRDEAALKPDPDGLRILRTAHPGRSIWVIGDSWIDGAAARAGGARFVAYGADPAELARRAVAADAVISDLRRLPAWLLGAGGRAAPVAGPGARPG
jgi:HAD superfamily hydrolase (TIGR01549 family)